MAPLPAAFFSEFRFCRAQNFGYGLTSFIKRILKNCPTVSYLIFPVRRAPSGRIFVSNFSDVKNKKYYLLSLNVRPRKPRNYLADNHFSAYTFRGSLDRLALRTHNQNLKSIKNCRNYISKYLSGVQEYGRCLEV